MQTTLALIEKCIARGWLNMAHLSEIRDTMIDEVGHELYTVEEKANTLERQVDDLQQWHDYYATLVPGEEAVTTVEMCVKVYGDEFDWNAWQVLARSITTTRALLCALQKTGCP